MTTPTAYPLAWPAGVPRTTGVRKSSPFKVSLSRAVSDLEDALRLFGQDTKRPVKGVIVSSNVTLAAHRPSDPGVAVYFEWEGLQRCIAVDMFERVEANVRAIYMILEGRRSELRYGGLHLVRATFSGFTPLPPPGEEELNWRTELGFLPSARPSAEEIRHRYRARAKERHPDAPGGSHEKMIRLNAALELALKGMVDG